MKKLALILFLTFTILILFACGTEKDSQQSINSSIQLEELFNKAVTLIENHFGSLLEFHEYGTVYVDDEIRKLVFGFKDEDGEKEKKFKEVIKKEFDSEHFKFRKLKYTTAEFDEMMNEIMVNFHNYEMGDYEFGINSKEDTLYLKTNGLTESEKSELLEKYGYILSSIEPLEESMEMNKLIDAIKVVVGAGEFNNNPGWIHTQEEELNLLDETTWQTSFEKNSIKAIVAEHVWEHLTYQEGLEAARLVFKYLKPAGYIRCAVPDGYFPDENYQNIVQVGGPGPKDHPAASHKIVHNFKTLKEMFESAGFDVKLLEYCDEEGNFYQNYWDGADGVIFRSKKYDPRNQGEKLVFPSLILDAVKPK